MNQEQRITIRVIEIRNSLLDMPEVTYSQICFSFCGRIKTFIARRPQRAPIIKHLNIVFNRLLSPIDLYISCWRFPTFSLIFKCEICYFSSALLDGLCIFSPQFWTWRTMTDNIYYIHSLPDSFHFTELSKSI